MNHRRKIQVYSIIGSQITAWQRRKNVGFCRKTGNTERGSEKVRGSVCVCVWLINNAGIYLPRLQKAEVVPPFSPSPVTWDLAQAFFPITTFYFDFWVFIPTRNSALLCCTLLSSSRLIQICFTFEITWCLPNPKINLFNKEDQWSASWFASRKTNSIYKAQNVCGKMRWKEGL